VLSATGKLDLLNKEKREATRENIAKALGVSTGKVKIHPMTRQTGVAKEDGVHVYNQNGEKVGVVNKPVYQKMVNVQDQLQRRFVAATNAGRRFSGIQRSSTVFPAFRNAHDPGFGNLKDGDGKIIETSNVSISEHYKGDNISNYSVKAVDGKTYEYSGSDLSLVSVADTEN